MVGTLISQVTNLIQTSKQELFGRLQLEKDMEIRAFWSLAKLESMPSFWDGHESTLIHSRIDIYILYLYIHHIYIYIIYIIYIFIYIYIYIYISYIISMLHIHYIMILTPMLRLHGGKHRFNKPLFGKGVNMKDFTDLVEIECKAFHDSQVIGSWRENIS